MILIQIQRFGIARIQLIQELFKERMWKWMETKGVFGLEPPKSQGKDLYCKTPEDISSKWNSQRRKDLY